MTDYQRNNLSKSSSPYLQQHSDNPIHWQEWNKDTLKHAQKNQKLIFVSIGYATCHWCHVMAAEAFSDPATADYINEHFVAIKVDKEQRPDIDQYVMSFVSRTTGRGGWPLNAVMSPEAKLIFGGTYFPHVPKQGLVAFKDVLTQVKKWYESHAENIQEYTLEQETNISEAEDKTSLLANIYRAFDAEEGGFGRDMKFPPHNTLLYLLHVYQDTKSNEAQTMIFKTLDAMSSAGLHDHLQGGFYRYCVDRTWTIPHFEKMLYDQAMLLWVYSLAFQLFQRERDREVVEKIIICLTETFSDGQGLFYSAHDADTDHIEGETYVWTEEELKNVLKPKEFELFTEAYLISSSGNFEGKNHLLKKNWPDSSQAKSKLEKLAKIEAKLLKLRKKRVQPFTDQKIISSWNALIGIGLLLAGRYLEKDAYKTQAFEVYEQLESRHFSAGKLAHSSLDSQLQKQEFLEDYAALLLFTSYLYEEIDDKNDQKKYKDKLKKLLKLLEQFQDKRDGQLRWYSNLASADFQQIPANSFDHPTPSAISLAELALFRSHKILEKDDLEISYRAPLNYDFHNLVAYFSQGHFHEIKAPQALKWTALPMNSLYLKSQMFQDCTDFTCHEFENEEDLLKSFA